MKPYKATGEIKTFRILWNITSVKSFVSDAKTPLNLDISCCAHMLSKKQFPYFRLYLGNLARITQREHYLLDHGTESQRISYSQEVKGCDWSKIYTLQDELRELYADTFPKKVGPMIMKYSQEEVSEKIASLNRSYLDTLSMDAAEIEQVQRVL